MTISRYDLDVCPAPPEDDGPFSAAMQAIVVELVLARWLLNMAPEKRLPEDMPVASPAAGTTSSFRSTRP